MFPSRSVPAPPLFPLTLALSALSSTWLQVTWRGHVAAHVTPVTWYEHVTPVCFPLCPSLSFPACGFPPSQDASHNPCTSIRPRDRFLSFLSPVFSPSLTCPISSRYLPFSLPQPCTGRGPMGLTGACAEPALPCVTSVLCASSVIRAL
jgi:hypothetical protein